MSVKDRLTAFRPFRRKPGPETAEKSESEIAPDAKLDRAQAHVIWSSSTAIGKTHAGIVRQTVRWENNYPWATNFDRDILDTKIGHLVALKRIDSECKSSTERLTPIIDKLCQTRLATILKLYTNEYDALASSGAEMAYCANVEAAAVTIEYIFETTDPQDTNRRNTRIARELPGLFNNMGLAKQGFSVMPSPIIY